MFFRPSARTGGLATALLLLAAVVLFAPACAPDLRPDLPREDAPDATGPVTSGPPSNGTTGTTPSGGSVSEGGACAYRDLCAAGLVCANEVCVAAPECRRIQNWSTCVSAVDELEEGLGRYATCLSGRCVVMCHTDADCSPGSACTDFGRCRPFTGTLGEWQETYGDLQPLRTGFAQTLINYPIGVPLGGYGERSGGVITRDRYASAMRSSVGTMHGMFIRAVALDSGERQMILISIPVIFIGADMHEAVARALQEATGRDWRDDLIITATHSHSGPARLWPLPDDSLVPLGVLGIGDYSQVIRDAMVGSLIDASIEALDNLEPGRFGWSIIEAFDNDDALARDRWGEIPPFDDNRLLLMRFDDEDGVPIAVAVSYGVHGTVNNEDFASNDVMTGIERRMEAALGEAYDRFVPVMFINQNSGSMSPSNDGQSFPQAFERAGYVFTDRFFDEVVAMDTSDTLRLRSRTYRFPLTYEGLGYEEGEFALGRNTMYFGGLQCADTAYEDDPAYENIINVERLNCLDVKSVFYNRPPTMFMTGQITAMTFDDLTVITAPGELTMPLGWGILQRLEQEHQVDPLSSWTFGYAQDHHLYLSPSRVTGDLPPFPGISTPRAPSEYPEFAFSWLRGGYHQTMTTWGWKYGDFIIDRALDAWRYLNVPGHEPAGGTALPRVLGERGDPPFPIEATPANVVGTIVEEPPSSLERFEPMEFAWIGGDPGAEAPQTPLVTLEREVDGSFEPVTQQNRRPYTNLEYGFMTRIRRSGGQWEWVVRWEELRDFPAGTYRLRVNGHYATTADDPDSRTPYEVLSPPFDLTPSTALELDGDRGGNTLSLDVHYPAYERLTVTRVLDRDADFDDRAALAGHFRLRDPHTRPGDLTPLHNDRDIDPEADGAITLTDAGGNTVDATITPSEGPRGTLRLTITLDTPTDDVTVTVTDRWGNTGSIEL